MPKHTYITQSDGPLRQTFEDAGVLHERVLAILASGVLGDCTGADAKVLISLIGHANWSDCRCWPGVTLIAKETRLNETTVKESLAHLAKRLGLLYVSKRRTPRGKTGNEYEILAPVRSPGDDRSPVDYRSPADDRSPPTPQNSPCGVVHRLPELISSERGIEHGKLGDGGRNVAVAAPPNPPAQPAPPMDRELVFVLSLSSEEREQAKRIVLEREPDVRVLLERYDPTSPSIAVRIYQLYHPQTAATLAAERQS